MMVREETVNQITQLLKEAGHILVGAGAGLSADAGLDYTDTRIFEELFPGLVMQCPVHEIWWCKSIQKDAISFCRTDYRRFPHGGHMGNCGSFQLGQLSGSAGLVTLYGVIASIHGVW